MIVYDTAVLIGADRGVRGPWSTHEEFLRRGVLPIVPTAVLAQAWRGGPQPWLSRLLTGCAVVALDEDEARAAGRLCALAGTSDVVDASVVVAAVERGVAVVTGDASDLRRLVAAGGTNVPVIEV